MNDSEKIQRILNASCEELIGTLYEVMKLVKNKPMQFNAGLLNKATSLRSWQKGVILNPSQPWRNIKSIKAITENCIIHYSYHEEEICFWNIHLKQKIIISFKELPDWLAAVSNTNLMLLINFL